MVIDEVNDKKFPRYLVYDIIKFEGDSVGQLDFNIRFYCIQKEIVGARNTYIVNVRQPKIVFAIQSVFKVSI